MKILKVSNALLVVALIAAAALLLASDLASLGAIAGLTLPIVAFSVTYIAFQRATTYLANLSMWLNGLLLAIYTMIDALTLFIFNVEVGNAIAIVVFQSLLIALPASANIVALKRLKATALKVTNKALVA